MIMLSDYVSKAVKCGLLRHVFPPSEKSFERCFQGRFCDR